MKNYINFTRNAWQSPNDQAEPRRSVLRQNIEETQSQLVIPPLALAPLLDNQFRR